MPSIPTEEDPIEEPALKAPVEEELPASFSKKDKKKKKKKGREVEEPVVPAEPELPQDEATLASKEPPQDPKSPASAPDQEDEWALPTKKSKKKKGKKGGSIDTVEPVIEEQGLEQPAAGERLSEPLSGEAGTDDLRSSLPDEVSQTIPEHTSREIPLDAADSDKKYTPDAGTTVPEDSEVKGVPTDLPAAEDVPAVTDELAEPQLPVPGAEDVAEPTSQMHDAAMEEVAKTIPSDEPVPGAEVSPSLADPVPEEPPATERSEATPELSLTDDVAASSTSKKNKKKKKGKKSEATDLDAAEPAQSSITPDKQAAEDPLKPAPEVSTEQLNNVRDLQETPAEVEPSEQQAELQEAVPETAEGFPLTDVDPASGEQARSQELQAALEPEVAVESPSGTAQIITEPTRDENLAAGEGGAEEWDLPSTKKGKKKKDKKRGKSVSDAIEEDHDPTPTDSTSQDVQGPAPFSEPTQLEPEPSPLEVVKSSEPEPAVEDPSSTKSKKEKKKGNKGTSEATTPAISRPESPVIEKESAPAIDIAQKPPIVDEPVATSTEAVEGEKQESEPILGVVESEIARAGPLEQEPEADSTLKPEDQLTAEESIIAEPDARITHRPEAEERALAAEPNTVPQPEPEALPIVEPEAHVPTEDTPSLGLNVSKKKGKKNKKKGQSASATPAVSRPLSPVNDDPPASVSEGHDVSVSSTPAADIPTEPTKEEPVATSQDLDDLGFDSNKGKEGAEEVELSDPTTPAAPRAMSPAMDEPSREQESIPDQTGAVQADIAQEATALVEEEVKNLVSTTEKKGKKRAQTDSDTTTPVASRAISPTSEEKTESPLPVPTEIQQVEDEWALPSKKKGKKKGKKAKTENEQPSEQAGQSSLSEMIPSESTRQLAPLLRSEPDATPSDARDLEAPTDSFSQPGRSTPALPIETQETRLIPAQTTSHITHEAPSGGVTSPEKKLKTDHVDSIMLSEPVMSIEEPIADVAPESEDTQQELALVKGKDADVSFTRDMDIEPQEKESRSEEMTAVVESSTAIGAAAAAAGVAALAGKSKKKGKKKKAVDERKEREGDLFDDPMLGESDGRKALTGEEEKLRDGDAGGKGADRGGLEMASDTHAVPMGIERGVGEIEKAEDVVRPAVVEEADTDVKPGHEERMATPEVVDQTVPVVVEEPVTGVEGWGSTDEVKTDALESQSTRGLVEKEPRVAPMPVDEAKPRSAAEDEPAPIAPKTPEMKAVRADPETTRGVPEATPEPAGERALSFAERSLPMPSVTDQPALGRQTRGRTALAPAWGEPEEGPVLNREEGPRGRSLGGETSPIPPVTPTRDLASPDNFSRGLTGDTLDASPFSPLRRSLSRNLEPVPEHPAESLDPPSKIRERRPKKLPTSAPDKTRDSGLSTESPRLGQRSRWQQEGPHRDSGVHLKEWADAPRQISPSPSGPRSMEPFKTPETSERRLKRSPRSAKDLREHEGPSSKTPVLRGPSPQAPTPEPQKSLRDYKTPDNPRSRYQDLDTPSLPAKKPSLPGPDRPSAFPRPSTSSPGPGQRSVSDNVSRSRLTPSPDPAPRRVASNTSFTRHRTPEPLRLRPDTPGSIRSLHSATPPLRRAGRRISGDLRSISLSQRDSAEEAPPATDSNDEHRSAQTSTPVANEGRVRSKDMTDVYVSRRV